MGDDPFRDASHAHSPTLARLAQRHPQADRIHDVERIASTDEAVGYAVGDPAPVGCLMMFGYVATVALVVLWLVGVVPPWAVAAGAGLVISGHIDQAVSRARWRRRVSGALTWIEALPFPVEGVRGFFAATTPMIDITFATPPTLAAFTAGVRGHVWDAEVFAIEPTCYRIALRHRAHDDADDGRSQRSNAAWLKRFVTEVLEPLHGDVGIEHVRLGGTTEPRPDDAPRELTPGDPT